MLSVIRDFTDTAEGKGLKVSLTGFKEVYRIPKAASECELFWDLMDAGLMDGGSEVLVRPSGRGSEFLEGLEEKAQIAPDSS